MLKFVSSQYQVSLEVRLMLKNLMLDNQILCSQNVRFLKAIELWLVNEISVAEETPEYLSGVLIYLSVNSLSRFRIFVFTNPVDCRLSGITFSGEE